VFDNGEENGIALACALFSERCELIDFGEGAVRQIGPVAVVGGCVVRLEQLSSVRPRPFNRDWPADRLPKRVRDVAGHIENLVESKERSHQRNDRRVLALGRMVTRYPLELDLARNCSDMALKLVARTKRVLLP